MAYSDMQSTLLGVYQFNVIFVLFPALVDVTNVPDQESPPIDIFAVGFEEIVDLNASNIMAAR
jgi:hypothetical protein